MSSWQEHAKKGVKAFEILGDGPVMSEAPSTGTRSASTPVRRLTLVTPMSAPSPSAAQPAPRITHVAHGSWAMGLGWMLWSAFGIAMVLQSRGGGAWLLWFAIGIPGWLCQSRNQIIVASHELLIRRGLTGDSDRLVDIHEITDVWAQQGLWGRLLDTGRIGLRLQDGQVVWGPLINDPVAAKHAVVAAVTGRAPLGIPPHLQEELRGY